MELTTWYLEQSDVSQIRPGREPATAAEIRQAELASPELSRFLYTAVGGDWFWTDRLPWTWQQWNDLLTAPGVETWVAWVRGTPAGFIELDGRHPGIVEIAYFGLLPGFTGQNLGGHLLAEGLRRAWSLHERWPHQTPITRVWVHTCSLDGPAALANYQARGMSLYKTEVTPAGPITETPGPWPGAGDRGNPVNPA
ncbi:GNAT superfamily N-acetyltransferase [Actinoplanes lutulentus]|uniref:Acetyltransferase (GNAT) family protein n=1 Tax=Actinoplanes lutulentus TaxID=1287878 RepID=A0A327ZF29_9ACTN|nr:GNAT family N-acetyltransferase [Actinoplanes lutulentus]MBB2942494.1 GNAT superfamily N-acetyltransferase [Actinoplanes lutulentus]RAK38075.1 acetyltransferase (GNAT) family protein [Actinoplanes lutulentus]